METEDYIEYICKIFSINEQVEYFLKSIHTDDINMIISELLLHTRRVGRCITFHELGLYVNFDRLLVCEYLAKSINYKEANYENAINPYLYELGLNFKQACICKSFIKTMNEFIILKSTL